MECYVMVQVGQFVLDIVLLIVVELGWFGIIGYFGVGKFIFLQMLVGFNVGFNVIGCWYDKDFSQFENVVLVSV